MLRQELVIGPIVGRDDNPIVYALDSDETYMQKKEDELTDHDKKVNASYVRDNTAFITAIIPSTKPEDIFLLHSEYETQMSFIEWHIDQFRKMGLNPTSNFRFAPAKQVAHYAKDIAQQNNIEIISTISYSYLLVADYDIKDKLEASIRVNSKKTLATIAETYDVSVPKTIAFSKRSITQSDLDSINFSDKGGYIKFDGLGGGNNIIKALTCEDLEKILKDPKWPNEGIIQEVIDDSFIEAASIFKISDFATEYVQTRVSMIMDGVWYGNIFLPKLPISDGQKREMYKIADVVKEIGYTARYDLHACFDGFIKRDEIYFTEINARYVGSNPPGLVLDRLGIMQTHQAVSSFDYIHEDEIEKYKTFCEEYLFIEGKEKLFNIIPLGFSAHTEENNTRLVYYVVIGDFEAFVASVKGVFSEKSFVTAENSLRVYKNVYKKMHLDLVG
jgi:hypothetical protein